MALISRAAKRRLRKIIGWEKVKEVGVYVLAALLDFREALPCGYELKLIELAMALLSAFYYFPVNPWRRACRDAAALAGGRETAYEVYSGLVARVGAVARIFILLLGRGIEPALEKMEFGPGMEERFRSVMEKHGSGFLLLPHCVGGVLSAAYFARVLPTVIISKGPASPRRAEIQRRFIGMLGVELLVIDNVPKSTVARRILRTIKSGKFIVATTDLMKKTDESLEAQMFSRSLHLPSWPARFSSKTGCPIVPGYVYVKGDRLEISACEPIMEKDITRATHRWAKVFEDYILGSPADWAFLFDLRWGKILHAAVSERSKVKG